MPASSRLPWDTERRTRPGLKALRAMTWADGERGKLSTQQHQIHGCHHAQPRRDSRTQPPQRTTDGAVHVAPLACRQLGRRSLRHCLSRWYHPTTQQLQQRRHCSCSEAPPRLPSQSPANRAPQAAPPHRGPPSRLWCCRRNGRWERAWYLRLPVQGSTVAPAAVAAVNAWRTRPGWTATSWTWAGTHTTHTRTRSLVTPKPAQPQALRRSNSSPTPNVRRNHQGSP